MVAVRAFGANARHWDGLVPETVEVEVGKRQIPGVPGHVVAGAVDVEVDGPRDVVPVLGEVRTHEFTRCVDARDGEGVCQRVMLRVDPGNDPVSPVEFNAWECMRLAYVEGS